MSANMHTGWVDDPAAVLLVQSTLPTPFFSGTSADGASDLPDTCYLWDFVRKVAGAIPIKNQNPVGSCVSFGTNTAVERTMAVEIAQGDPETWYRICEEVTYGGSRVEVGGGRIRGDGSVGAWAADFVRKWGVVDRANHGSYDLREYDAARCRDFGQNGVPDQLEQIARKHPVADTTMVRTADEARRALASGYGIAVCSSQGFEMRRDAKGICDPSGGWAHCMCIDGYHVEAGKLYFHVENSWGPDAHTGPVGWGNPTTAGFWTYGETIARMLAQSDSWAFSKVSGWPARKLDWSQI